MDGNDNQLFRQVMELTGLPEELIRKELDGIIRRVGSTPEALTLEELRGAVLSYLLEVVGPEVSDVSTLMSEKKI